MTSGEQTVRAESADASQARILGIAKRAPLLVQERVTYAGDRVIEVVGHAGAEPGAFANPWAIALDSKGNLYVADSQNHRVQKLIRKQ